MHYLNICGEIVGYLLVLVRYGDTECDVILNETRQR